MTEEEKFMKEAIRQAKKAEALNEVPIGCVIVHQGKIIGRGYNRRMTDHSVLAHAEIIAIKKACKKIGDWRLEDCTIYITLEPCPMCAGAIINSRIDRVVYGASDYKGGAVESLFNVLSHPGLNHEPQLQAGILADECSQLMKDFFKERRKARRSTQEAEGSALEMR